MLIKQNNQGLIKFVLASAGLLLMQGCAHQTTITPSNGHINGGVTASAVQQNAAVPIPAPVQSSPVLPPPKPISRLHTYSVVVNEVPVKEILFALARESKLNVDIDPAIQGRVTLNAVDQTLPAILERLARQVDLTYKMENNTLYITPDQPVLRTYKIDYVNMNRDTKGFIGAAAEISTTGQSASVGANGQTTTTNTSGNGANNSSRTAVTSESKNHLWESLIQNIKDILAETDKEVIVNRYGSLDDDADIIDASLSPEQAKQQAESKKLEANQRKEQRLEYKTLLAANVIANAETGVISVRATSKQHEKIREFIDLVMGSAKKQVLIEATIVEVRLNDGYQAGINWSKLNLGNFSFSQVLTPLITASPSNTTASAGLSAGFSTNNISAAITLLQQFGNTKVLSSPKLMVLNNQTAVLKVVDNLVYFTIQAQQSQGTNGSQNLSTITTTPNTVPVGIVMSVTPQISNAGTVNIDVRPTISSLIRYVPDPNPNITNAQTQSKLDDRGIPLINQGIPEIQVREMESILQVNSGNTAVLGGLMQDQIARNTDQVPGLGDIPGIGNLFKSKNDATRKTELVIFLRPTVISNASLESDELQSYKQYLPAQQLEKALEEAN